MIPIQVKFHFKLLILLNKSSSHQKLWSCSFIPWSPVHVLLQWLPLLSFVLLRASFFRTSTYVSTGCPSDRCPHVGSIQDQPAGRALWQWAGSLILLVATFLLSLGSCLYRSLLAMWVFWSTFRTARSILV